MKSCKTRDHPVPPPNTSRKRTKEADLNFDPLTLPPEIWVEIFQQLLPYQLLQVRLVCRHWRSVLDGSSPLLAKLVFSFPKKLTIDREYEPAHPLPVPKVCFESSEITAVGPWWTPFGQKLTEIALNGCKIKLSELLEMLKGTPNLKCLELLDYAFDDDRGAVAEDCRLDKVEKLSLDGQNVTKMSEFFLGSCRNLKSLRITWNSFGTRDAVSAKDMAKLVGGFRSTLTELYINGSNQIMEELVQLEPFKELKKLTLTFEPVELEKLIEFFKKHPSLEYVDVHEVVELGYYSDEIREMVKTLPDLKHLSINLAPFFSVDLTFLSKWTKLQSLSLYGYQLENESEYALQLPYDGLPNLKQLHLEGFVYPGENLEMYLDEIPNLHTLSIESCWFDCWSNLLRAVERQEVLRSLSLDWLKFTDPFSCPFECLPSLEIFDVNLDDMPQSLGNSVLSLCPHLRELSSKWRGERTINNEVLRVICQKLTKEGEFKHTK